MKANYIKSRTEAIKIANQAAKEQMIDLQTEAYEKAATDIVEQLTVMHLYILTTVFGFGEKRLKKFLVELNLLNDMMMKKDTFYGRRATPEDVRSYMENKYHLDLMLKEVMIERKEKTNETQI